MENRKTKKKKIKGGCQMEVEKGDRDLIQVITEKHLSSLSYSFESSHPSTNACIRHINQ